MDYKEKIIALLNSQELSKEQKEKLESIFPALKESEDDEERARWIAWLEKQGEKKATDTVEPKFKVGDWVVNKFGDVWHIDSFDKKNYQASNGNEYNYFPISKQNEMHLWTIQDAKDGDILINKNYMAKHPFIFKETKPSNIKTDVPNTLTILGYCGIGVAGFAKGNWWGNTANCIYYPATKEQRDLLFSKMKEAGYEWDAKKKELNKIEQKLIIEMKSAEESLGIDSDTYNKIVDECIYGEQNPTNNVEPKFKVGDIVKDPYGSLYHITKIMDDSYKTDDGRFILFKNEDAYTVFMSAWSEEDEMMIKFALTHFRIEGATEDSDIIKWLKSLKKRVQPKKDWSEEDERERKHCIDFLNHPDWIKATPTIVDNCKNWLKSLKSQNTWKPSDEQMKALKEAVDEHFDIDGGALWHLYEDLKKLKD